MNTSTTNPTVTLPEAAQIIESTWTQPDGHRVVISLLGPPGIGKSGLTEPTSARLAPRLGVTPDRIFPINISHCDLYDIPGMPDISGDVVRWKPPVLFHALREGTGPAILIVDEAAGDLATQMQNILCRVCYDRCAGDLRLTDRLYILLTGNRVEDKSGATRLSTKLGNRMLQLTVAFDQPAWEAWAHEHGVGADIIAFHRWKADTTDGGTSSAFAFDANRSINPTPRAWAEMASRLDRSLPPATYLAALASCLTLGPATEFVAFQQYWKDLPAIEAVWANPTELPLPTALQGQYALAMYVASLVQPGVATQFFTLVQRLPNMLRVPTVMAATKRCPGLVGTAAYSQWAIANAHIMF
jgi:hypothetical protein